MSYHSLLNKLKFRMVEDCNCGGSKLETWQRDVPLIILKVRPDENKFWIHGTIPAVEGHLSDVTQIIRKQIVIFTEKYRSKV